MPGHIATAALAAVAIAAPVHSAHAHLPLGRHVAAASSFGPQAPAPTAARTPANRATRHRHRTVHVHDQRVAHAAADPAVRIADFHFTPLTRTVHVGDTITWTNDGPSSHTATARDGSFDTGTLSRGRSASRMFTRAGTYAYVCAIHPFMHGTITVLAAAATAPTTRPTPTTTSSTPAAVTTSSSATTSTPATATTPTLASATPTLPVTGMDVLGAVAAGTILTACGLALRRAVRA